VDRAKKGAGRRAAAVVPERFLAAEFAGFDHADQAAFQSGRDVPQRIAATEGLVPNPLTELGHRHGAGEHQGPFLGGDRHQYVPLGTHRKRSQQLRPIDLGQIFGQPLDQPLPVRIIGGDQFGVGLGIGIVDGAPEKNLAADHADTRPITEHIRRIFGVDPADHGQAAAVEFGKGIAHRAKHPHLRALILRVPFGHGQTAGTDGAADHDPAAGHGVADAVGGIALDNHIRADIEVADIVGGRTFADDGGSLQAHAAKPLPGRSLDPDGQGPVD